MPSGTQSRAGVDVDDSFTWMINFIDDGLQATTATRTRGALAR